MSVAQIVWVIAAIIVIVAGCVAFLSLGRRRGLKRVRDEHVSRDSQSKENDGQS
ncbi:hypothetical protein [Arthrobacter sp. H14-L1]|uniref:hypothetical protein n=1 Tax=Arthrobacter sp. H14-L1 TaxID=2996697 RepID=UPI00227143DF|nr:hypothetical protein [Arthrobacter sp. H14-L1]MCY0905327.1 hypothetical protein [Arthrobacter sp. H14-L1]